MESFQVIEIFLHAKAYIALFTYILCLICIIVLVLFAIPVKNEILSIWRSEERVLPGLVSRLKDDCYSPEDALGVMIFLKLAIACKITSLKELDLEAKDLTNLVIRADILKMAGLLADTKNQKKVEKIRLEIDGAIRAGIVTKKEVYR